MGDQARYDKAKNRIYVRFDGYMDLERAQQLHDAYRAAIAEAKPGFTVMTFAEGYKPGGKDVQDIVSKMVKLAEEGGCAKVARVVGDNPLGGMQINRLAKERAKYQSQHFKTEVEAEAYLDQA